MVWGRKEERRGWDRGGAAGVLTAKPGVLRECVYTAQTIVLTEIALLY